MTLQTVASFLEMLFWPLLLVATTLANYLGARLAHIEGNVPWRAFFTALTAAFATVIVASLSSGTLTVNPLYWIGVYAVVAALITKSALRTDFRKALVPWLFAVLIVAAVFLIRYFSLGVPSIGT